MPKPLGYPIAGFLSSPNGRRSQTAAEYLLLIALGMVVLMVGIAVALQLRNLSDAVALRVGLEQDSTIAMLITPNH